MIAITIDGEAASGKSYIAYSLSKKINYTHLETGIIYRAITFYLIKNKLIGKNNFNHNQIINRISNMKLDFKIDYEKRIQFFLDDISLGDEIISEEVSKNVPKVSKIDQVRHIVNKKQYEVANDGKGFVIEGRDSGSVVFPKAELKIFVKANLEKRANRRYLQLKKKRINLCYDDVLQSIKDRDNIDKNREIAPLIIPHGALIIDNTSIEINKLIEDILIFVNEKRLLI